MPRFNLARTYNRTYSFNTNPNIGEVHIHWRPLGQFWYPSKLHFKKDGQEGEVGAQYQYDLSPPEANALGIAVAANEKLTDKYMKKN